MIPEDLSQTSLLSALDGARVVYFDARMRNSALVIAHEVGYICNCYIGCVMQCFHRKFF